MAPPDSTQSWREAEEEYTDEVIGTNTLPALFEQSFERYSGTPAQMYKGGIYPRSITPGILPEPEPGSYRSISYERLGEIVRNLATGFRELGVEDNDRVGMFSNTRMEWTHCDFALLAAGGVVTTVYTESSPKQIKYLLNDPGATGVVVENEYLLDRIIKVEEDLSLDFVVVLDELNKYEDVDQIHSLADVYEMGEANFDEATYQSWIDSRSTHDLASLIYTSGTTGKPKGVKLTHYNFRANINHGPTRPTTFPASTRVTSPSRSCRWHTSSSGPSARFSCSQAGRRSATQRRQTPSARTSRRSSRWSAPACHGCTNASSRRCATRPRART